MFTTVTSATDTAKGWVKFLASGTERSTCPLDSAKRETASGSWSVGTDLPAMLATSTTANGVSQGHTSKVTAKDTKQLGTCINVCHFNAEGLSKAKSECIGRVMSDNKIDVLAVQETHCT